MTSKERVQYNDDEEVNETYEKILAKAAVRTSFLHTPNKPWYLILTLPLRITEFITTLLLFAIVVYLSTESESGLRNTTTIYMITLTSSFLFFACIQIIAHLTASNLPEYPFVFFNFLGMCFYTAAGTSILYTAPTRSWGRLASFLLCFLIAGFHTASVLIILIFWRERFRSFAKYNTRTSNKIYPSTQMLYSRSSGGFNASDACHCEMATSVSNYGVLEAAPVDAAVEAHGSRKVETARRRSYMDRHCSCPEVLAPKAIEVQTECGKNLAEETQTHLEVKEIIIQTLSKCDLCNRQMIEPEPTPVTSILSEEIPPKPSCPCYLPSPPTSPTQSISSPPLQMQKFTDQAIQSGCVMPCPNVSTPTPFYIIPGGIGLREGIISGGLGLREGIISGGLGLREGINPCCVACNCGHTPTSQPFCPPPPPEPEPPPPPPSPPPPPPPPPQPWATCETLVVESGPCEKNLIVNPGDKTARKTCPGIEPQTSATQRIKIATKIGTGSKQVIDCHSPSSVLIQKNKKTQTKVKTYVCASEESSDEKDDKKACRCRRVLHVRSEIKDGSKMQKIDKDCSNIKEECIRNVEFERKIELKESCSKSTKRTKPLYRETLEGRERKSGHDSRSDNDHEKFEQLMKKESKQHDQNELHFEMPRRFKSKVSPSPSPTQTSHVDQKSEETTSSKPTWQRFNKNSSDNDNPEDATVRIEDVTDDNQHSRQSPVNYFPQSQSTVTREYQIDQLIKAHDEPEVKNEFPEEF